MVETWRKLELPGWTNGLCGRRRRGAHPEFTIDYLFLLFLYVNSSSVRRTHTPRTVHSAR
jgi:hypothetical protein